MIDALTLTAGGIVGAIVGSFVGVLVIRWPQERGVVAGRSRCDHCRAVLHPSELIPLLSYVIQRGRCRRCGHVIAIDQFVAELLGAGIGILAAATGLDAVSTILTAAFAWTLLALAMLDLRHRWLPDRLTLPLLVGGLMASALDPGSGTIDRLAAALLGYSTLQGVRLAYRHLRGVEGMGGGDPKLLAAIGAWTGLAILNRPGFAGGVGS